MRQSWSLPPAAWGGLFRAASGITPPLPPGHRRGGLSFRYNKLIDDPNLPHPVAETSFAQAGQYADLAAADTGADPPGNPPNESAAAPTTILQLASELPIFPGNPERHAAVTGQINQLAEQYSTLHPAELEGITILTQLPAAVQAERTLNAWDTLPVDRQTALRQLTEYHFLLIHYALENVNDPHYMHQFWEAAHLIAGRANKTASFEGWREGALAAVATMQAFRALGLDPRLSHPQEDAQSAIDIWAGTSRAIQVKKHNRASLNLINTDHVEYPAVEVDQPDGTKVYSIRYPKNDVGKFVQKIQRYSHQAGRSVAGYFVGIPYSMIDHDTGQPSPELIKQLEQKLASGKTDPD